MKTTEMAYVGIDKCGCTKAAVVARDDTKEVTADAVATYIRMGYAVERVTAEKANSMLAAGCIHEYPGIVVYHDPENPDGETRGA
jgi:hypothetical protein